MLASAAKRATAAVVHNVGSDVHEYADGLLMSSNYIDLGSCTEVCEFCGALFWYLERVKSFALSVRPQYNGCCKG